MERKKLLTCSWLTGEGVGGMVMGVVVLEVDEKEEDMNCCVTLASSVSVFFYRLWGVVWHWWCLFPVPRCVLFQGILSSELEIPLPCFYFWSQLCLRLSILLLLRWSLVRVFLRISHIGCSLVWAKEGEHGKWGVSSSVVVVLAGSWQVQFFPKFRRGLVRGPLICDSRAHSSPPEWPCSQSNITT